ncbi:DUF488 domain-containing protein [Starkeya sp. ORNL1]|uniref:DUF488 domain-containing protein n=1 Tax=Starkeya sp. ORNL1 TaxID=2709380 RepID=UPI0014629B87|nr:DUF488 domain-containing protein [Starkeya sp. ORNL1]QJP17671.1 DUF488 domain-containing protein [Starkeya sp. ORNL1]
MIGAAAAASAKDLWTKRIYEKADTDDGARVLVDRIWPRGLTKQTAALTLWLKNIAPSTSLRKWFGHDPDRWEEFCRRYYIELAQDERALGQLCDLLKNGKVTLLYGAKDTEHNQAVALRNYLVSIR